MAYNKEEEEERYFESLLLSISEGKRPYIDSDTAYDLADFLLNNERADDAAIVINYSLEIHPNETDLLILKSIVLVETDSIIEARSLLKQVSATEDSSPELYKAWGVFHIATGATDKAEAAFEKALSYEKENGCSQDELHETLLNIASTCNRHSAYKQAGIYADRLLADSPEDTFALFEKAYSEEKLGNDESAIALYRKQLKIHPFADISWYNLALIHSKLGLYDEAIKYYNTHLALAPYNTEAYLNYANTLISNGQYQEAINEYCQYISHEKYYEEIVFQFLGEAWAAIADSSDEDSVQNRMANHYAEEFFRLSTTRNGSDPHAWFLLSDQLLSTGKTIEALKCINKAIAIDASNCNYHYLRAAINEQNDDLNEAMSDILKGLAQSPNDVRAWLELTRVMTMLSYNTQEAITKLSLIRDTFPSTATESIDLAQALLKFYTNKKSIAAVRLVEKVAQCNPKLLVEACENTTFAKMMEHESFQHITISKTGE
ncbi:MAG: tetratricopeptide repeat protein [Marinilabiliaceae bacterium]|nr:tetratricopeptide repeat protein [Marinilabiliaceae bacterium]